MHSHSIGPENEYGSPYNKYKDKIQVRATCEKTKPRTKNLLVRRPVIFKKLLLLVSFCSHCAVSMKISKGVEYALKRRRIKSLVIISPIKY